MGKVPFPPNILNIAYHLAEDVEKRIEPHRCIFEPTKKGSRFHYMVCCSEVYPRKREKVIAWADVRKRRLCLSVSIICNLSDWTNDPIVHKLRWKQGASWGQSGRDECDGIIYEVNDQDYHVVLHALVVAAKGWLLSHC